MARAITVRNEFNLECMQFGNVFWVAAEFKDSSKFSTRDEGEDKNK